MFPIISNNKSSHLTLKFSAPLESSCSCLLLSKFLLLHNSCRTMNVRHAIWTAWPGSPWETWQVSPRQRKYRTYTWFLDLGIDSKAFCFHCWLVIVCFTWGKETIVVISCSGFQHELSAQTSLVFAPRCIPTYPRSTTEKSTEPQIPCTFVLWH